MQQQPTNRHLVVVYTFAGLALSALVGAMLAQQAWLLLPFLGFALLAGFYYHKQAGDTATLELHATSVHATATPTWMLCTTTASPIAYREGLRAQGLVEKAVPGDGNCFFHAINAQHRDAAGRRVPHTELRAQAANYLLTNAAKFVKNVSDQKLHSVQTYADQLKTPKTWVDELGVMAMAQALNAVIVVHSDRLFTKRGDDAVPQPQPLRCYPPSSITDTTPVYQVVHVNQNHYNQVTWADGTPASTRQAFEATMRQEAREIISDATTSPPTLASSR